MTIAPITVTSQYKFVVEAARNGSPALKAIGEGREVWLHSPYDPEKEGEAWAQEAYFGQEDIIIVLGLGLGYHVRALCRVQPQAQVLVIEPDRVIASLFKEHMKPDSGEFLNKVKVYSGDVAGIKEFLTNNIGQYDLDRVKVLEYQPLKRILGEEYKAVAEQILDVICQLRIDANTTLYFANLWTDNFFSNLPTAIHSMGVSQFFGRFTGKPAVIVSAGPSLDKNIHLLSRVKGRALIIVVGTALKPVLKQKVMPDLVISIDGSELNYRHFVGVTDCAAPLIFEPTVFKQIIKEYAGPKIVFGANPYTIDWFEKHLRPKGQLRAGISVANIAFDLALKLGASPVIFIGQDLAYPDGKSHARETSWQNRNPLENKSVLLEVEDINGGKVVTDRSLYSMLQWFARVIREQDGKVEVIDATEGGAYIPGTKVLSLQTVIDQYLITEFDAEKTIQDALDQYKPLNSNDLQDLIKELDGLHRDLLRMKKLALKGIEKSLQLEQAVSTGKKAVSKIVKRLDALDVQLQELKEASKLLQSIFHPIYVQLLESLKDDVKREERERSIARRSVILYRGIKDCAEVLLQLVLNAQKELTTYQ